MNHVPDTELFSAYLDGELTAEEQVRAEQILAASAEARQLLEELRALQSTVQGLSQEKLGEDISARVLEIAERRMLLPESPDNRPSAGRAAESLNPETDSLGWLGIRWREISWRGMLSPRALAWSAVVVVTAIIIQFTSPPKPNQNIARNDRPAEPSERPAAQPSIAADSRPDSSEHLKDVPKMGNSLAAEGKEPATATKPQESSIPPDGVWDAPADRKREARSGEKLAEKSLHKSIDAKDSGGVMARDRKVDEDFAKKETPARRMEAADNSGDASRALALRHGAELRAEVVREKPIEEKPAPEPAKGAGLDYKADPIGAVREEKAKSAAPIDGIAAVKPALPPMAAPMPAAPKAEKTPSPSTGQPGASLADASNPAGESLSSTNTEMSKPSLSSKTRGTESVANAKSGVGALGAAPNKAISEASGSRGSPAKGDVSEQTLNETVGRMGGDRLAYGGASAAGNRKGGQAPLDRFSDQAPTIVRFNVSAVAVKNRVFENLLASHGLASDKQANLALNGQASEQNYSYFQLNQAGRGTQSPFLPQSLGAGMGGMGGGGNILPRPSRLPTPTGSPVPAGLAGGGLNQQPENPKTDPSSAQRDARSSSQSEELGRSQSVLQGKAASKPEVGRREEIRNPVKDNGIKDNLVRDNAGRDKEQEGLDPLVYEFDATAEQLANIMKQIRDKPGSFAPLEPALDDTYRAANNAGYGGRTMSQRTDIQKQSKAADGAWSFSVPATQPPAAPTATAQSQAGPDAEVQSQPASAPARVATQQVSPSVARSARQHVVFIFNVVDRLSPAAAAASRAPVQAPAPASQSPVLAPASQVPVPVPTGPPKP